MPDPTPGETAWMAFQERLHALTQALPFDYPRPFATLAAVQRAACEAAAEAVRDLVLRELIAGGAQAREERDHD